MNNIKDTDKDTERDLQDKFEKFLEQEGLNQQKKTKYIIDGGKGKVVTKKAKDAKYTVLFENAAFLKAKAIARYDGDWSFNKIVNQALNEWIKRYIQKNGLKSIEDMLELNDQMNKEYFLTQRENMTRTKEKRKKGKK